MTRRAPCRRFAWLGLLLVTAMAAAGLVSDLAEDGGLRAAGRFFFAAHLHQALLLWSGFMFWRMG